MTAPEPQPELEASDLGRFEPTPYDLGISDNPDASWSDFRAEPDPEAEAEWADNWDSEDSHAYMDRVEAGLEPEAEP